MSLPPLLILMVLLGLVVGIVFPSWVLVLLLAPVSVAIGYTAGKSRQRKELR